MVANSESNTLKQQFLQIGNYQKEKSALDKDFTWNLTLILDQKNFSLHILYPHALSDQFFLIRPRIEKRCPQYRFYTKSLFDLDL